MRRFSGQPDELNSKANFLTEAIELRSNSITSIFADGISFAIVCFMSLDNVVFLTPIITWTPRSASTRAVSAPIPLVAPENSVKPNIEKKR